MNRIVAAEIILQVEKSLDTYDFHVLGLPFGGPMGGKDLHHKFFSNRTNFGIEKGHMLPTTYFHGRTPTGKIDQKPELIGTSEFMGVEEDGGWFMTRINKASKWADRLYQAGRKKALRASTGLAGTLQRWWRNGEYSIWVPGEIGMVDKQVSNREFRGVVNDLAIGVPVLKALYQEAGLEWENVVEHEVQSEPIGPGRKKIVLPRKKRIVLP